VPALTLRQVDAFTREIFKGNPVAVVLEADHLKPAEKRAIAAEIAAPEAVFVSPAERDHYRLEFFSRHGEFDFSAHGTLAAFHSLAEKSLIAVLPEESEHRTVATRTGRVFVHVERLPDAELRVTIEQGAPRFDTWEGAADPVRAVLGLRHDALLADYPIGIVVTASRQLLVPVRFPEQVDDITYDRADLTGLLRERGLDTAYVFAPAGGARYHARNFAPTYGVDEDPGSGTAAGALGAYLARGRLHPEEEGAVAFTVVQGSALHRESLIDVRVETTPGAGGEIEILKILVGGTARTVFEGTLFL
jgi:trans-2,3-dihydro-3-hydroxyanthranilate isomerase